MLANLLRNGANCVNRLGVVGAAHGPRWSSTATASGQFFHLSYNYVEGILEKRAPHRAGHLAHAQAHIDRGEVLMGGAFADASGACIVFRCENASVVEKFVADDPYVQAGLVVGHAVQEWNVVVGSPDIVGEA